MLYYINKVVILIKNIYKIEAENGYYLFKLEKLLDDKKISKNKIVSETDTDFKVIQRISKGNLSRIDIDVMDRLCNYLNCDFNDIIEYKRNK